MRTAMEQEGKPYVWNASGPDAFDCSGFVHYVLKTSLGTERFSLPYSLDKVPAYKHQSLYYRDQLRARGAQIDCANAQHADIVFFSRSGENNHIGLITNPEHRYFVTAQGKGLGVAVHSYAEKSYWGARNPECYRNVFLQ
ncbi:MAG TPA: NlpC/P60 family protein [Bdellovibrionota bacterium]|jgi:cell wall-associated NlpC family hydrolase|nr:NlpC/P60 family protein [Bdellovibrionota bacterium]